MLSSSIYNPLQRLNRVTDSQLQAHHIPWVAPLCGAPRMWGFIRYHSCGPRCGPCNGLLLYRPLTRPLWACGQKLYPSAWYRARRTGQPRATARRRDNSARLHDAETGPLTDILDWYYCSLSAFGLSELEDIGSPFQSTTMGVCLLYQFFLALSILSKSLFTRSKSFCSWRRRPHFVNRNFKI